MTSTSDLTTVLGIAVTDRMLDRWRRWTLPPVQPFLVPLEHTRGLSRFAKKRAFTAELRDTFQLYDPVPADHRVLWLDKAGAALLADDVVAAQPATHRWPTASAAYDTKRAVGFVKQGVPPSVHARVSDATWKRAAELLPDARRLSGRFRPQSGPNSFGTVMAAAGVVDAEDRGVQPESFEGWLAATTIPGGNDELPGTVYVWRDPAGVARHAGVSLGDGWYLHKPSSGWMSPTLVLDVREGINASRHAGQYIERHTILPEHLRALIDPR